MYAFLILALLLVFGTVTWRDTRFGLFLIAAALPSYLLRFSIVGIPTTLLELLIVFFVGIWFVKHGRTFALPAAAKRWVAPISLLLLASIVAVFASPNTTAALGVWKAYFVEPVLLFLIAHDVLREEKDREQVVLALGIGGLFVALFGLVQWVTGLGFPVPWDLERRVTSVFPYPNAVGLYLGPIIVLGGFAWRRQRVFWSGALPLMLLAVVLAQSEAAYVALLATAIIAGLLMPRTRIPTMALVALATVLVMAIPTIRQPVFEKLTLHDYSGEVRRSQWTETVAMLQDHWAVGAGLSGYPTVFAPYHQATQYEIFQYPHNILLNVWVELGLLGLAAFGALVLATVHTAWPALRETARGNPHPLAVAAVLALGEMTVHGLVDVPYFKNDLAVLTWLLLALLSLSSTYERHR